MASPLPVVNVADLRKLIRMCLRTNTIMEIISAPGAGKTTIVGEESAAYVRACNGVFWALPLAQCDQSDLGGIPCPVGDTHAKRLPIGAIHALSQRGGVLFLDEFANANSAIKGSALTLLQGHGAGVRYAGDTAMHTDTRFILASNPPEQGEGGHESGGATLGRMLRVKFVPELSEMVAYFGSLHTRYNAPQGSTLDLLSRDLAATLSVEPKLLQVEPPPGSIRAQRPWGSGRAWERGIVQVADLIDHEGDTLDSEAVYKCLSGNVSEETGGAYLAIVKVRKELPSLSEIEADPINARLPASHEQEIASVGLLQHVGLKSPEAAWIYAERLSEEIQIVAYRGLMRFVLSKGKSKSKLIDRAIVAQSKIMGRSTRNGALQVTGW